MILGIAIGRWLAAGIFIALYLLMCGYIVLQQRRKRQAAERDAASLLSAAGSTQTWLVAYASQTGNAEQLAWQTARALHSGGIAARVERLGQLRWDDLQHAGRALFIVSTYGEGDPPDNAVPFARKCMNDHAALNKLHYGLLALGDRSYTHFCGFGRSLDHCLQARGAQPLFERIDVNLDDAQALAAWRQQLAQLTGTDHAADWQTAEFEDWILHARQHLNPGSAGNPVFHLELKPATGELPTWQAGDLVEILAPADPERAREYSIASLPDDGSLHLMVRQECHVDGSLGKASGWLTEQASLGAHIRLRVHPHRNFQLGDNAHRDLILIGNGTGLAGLRAHIKARAGAAHQNWLIFGERNAAFDSHYHDELTAWQQQGILSRVDLVFSRDQAQRRYVQHHLRECAADLKQWLSNGAAIYVCGSLKGMGTEVHQTLTDLLGADGVDRLIETGRYRRDVY